MKTKILTFCRCAILLLGILICSPTLVFGESPEETIGTITTEIHQSLKDLILARQITVLGSLGLVQAQSGNIFAAKITFMKPWEFYPYSMRK